MRACLLLLLGLLSLPMARGEIRFAQLTDPHLFDPGQQATNEYALQWCIDQINTSIAGGVQYAFVVVTGDIGIENLGGFSDTNKTNAPGKRPDPSPQDIVHGAEVFARHISTSRVRRWLFIPGNNDLLQEDPKTISHYQTFIRTLANLAATHGITVQDLAPKAGIPDSGFHDEPVAANSPWLWRFIGFNNASFKANDSQADAKNFETNQLSEIEMVSSLLPPTGGESRYRGASVFYHIPEVEDPYWGSLPEDNASLKAREAKRGDLAKAYPLSAWTVTQKVRDEWMQVVTNSRVQHLFAGHFHSHNRAVYEGFGWMHPGSNYTATLKKLIIAPPIAIKKQDDKPVPARGYREVAIDGETGHVVRSEIRYFDVVGSVPSTVVTTDGPRAFSGEAPGSWTLITQLILVPFLALIIFGAIVLLWRKIAREHSISSSSAGSTTMLMVGLTLGSVLIGFSALGLLAHCEGKDACHVIGVGALWALTALAVGGSGGVLFGTPRAMAKPDKDGATKPKTNLEEISDWLTKLIIGGSLFSSGTILAHLKGAGGYFATTVSGTDTGLWSGVGTALLVYFVIVGFFGAYFPMRLYLGRVIDEADNGRSVVSDRTGLPETKLDALEAAPLNLEQVGDEFDPIAKEAAAEIGAIPLESLTNWRDVRLWAKAKLSDKDWNSAMKGYQKAIEIVPNDAESRLGYAAALSAKGSKKDIILRHLEAAHDCLMPKSPRDLRKNVFKSLIYQFLYLKRPESFLGALNYAREYFTHPDAVESGGIWINIACAYGQAYSWVSESEKNVLEYEKMLVKPNQSKPSEGTGETAQQRALQWLNEQALIAVKQAISRDRAWKEKVAMLMGIKPQEPPPKSPEDADLDLAPFSKDTAFLAVINNGTAVRAM